MTDNSTRTDLFSATAFGSISVTNRIVMAPVTRSRYGESTRRWRDCSPTALLLLFSLCSWCSVLSQIPGFAGFKFR
jgi:hypothetical protein